jgi:general secretion pathway protein G
MFMPRNRNYRPPVERTGFTLMEVLLVLVILVVLASLSVTVFQGTREGADIDAAKAQIGLFKTSIDLFNLHTGRYPDDLESLAAEPADASLKSRWRGPYMEKVPVDPWGNPYRIVVPGKHRQASYDLWSAGPDGQDNSDDDIGNWET